MLKSILAVMLLAASAQAQNVTLRVGRTYTIPYVINSPGANLVGQQVTATHTNTMTLRLARAVVVPTTSASGDYAVYSDNYSTVDRMYHFVAIQYATADAGVLPIMVNVWQIGEYNLNVMQCTTQPPIYKPTCIKSVTHITAVP